VPLDTSTTANTDNTAVSASSALGQTTLAAADTNLGGTSSGLETTAPPATTTVEHGSAAPAPTTGTETTGGHVTVHNTGPAGHTIHGTIQSTGDPHFTTDLAGNDGGNNAGEWTQTGVPGDTYLVASGNGVFLSALYGQNGGWNYCTMQCAQLTIPANSAAGINGEVQISYGLYDRGQIQVSTTDANGNVATQDYNANGFGQNGTMTFGSGTGAVSVNFQGDVVTVNTETSTGQAGSMTIDSSGQLYLQVSLQGTFDNASGIMQYVASESAAGLNFGDSSTQATMDAYAEANFNLTALSGTTDSAFIINPNGQPGFSNWVQNGHSNWNSPWTNSQVNNQ